MPDRPDRRARRQDNARYYRDKLRHESGPSPGGRIRRFVGCHGLPIGDRLEERRRRHYDRPMAEGGLITTTDLVLRGGTCAVLLLVAFLLVRDHLPRTAARLGALFAVGAAGYALCSAPQIHAQLGWWTGPVLGIAAANNLVLWLFARALFDDDFRPRWRDKALWGAVATLGIVQGAWIEPQHLAAAALVHRLLSLQALAFAVLAAAETFSSWSTDLVEPRRRMRLFIIIVASAYTVVTGLLALIDPRPLPNAASLAEAVILLVVAATIAAPLLRIAGDRLPFAEVATVAAVPPQRAADPPDPALLARLEHSMRVERLYRHEGLTIGQLAQRQNLPEYKLRRLINQGLGYRNFASFLNHYRIADAKTALADPTQLEVPILTIALDAGFTSLGPFNRAFKAQIGTTPSEYRRSCMEAPSPILAVDGSFAIPAGRISKSA